MRPVAAVESSGILFMGSLDYQPNVDAAFLLRDSIWPLIRRDARDASLYIVGRNPPPKLLEGRKPRGVHIAANVPSVVPYAKKCSISVVPIRVGGGTRVKVLVSMALGLPVVSTSIGCEGLNLKDETELIRVDDESDFARRTVQLLRDKEQRRRLSRAGRSAVEKLYDWQQIFPTLEGEYQEVVRGSRTGSAA
jgi:glycosyltransferase involved in cell wall biosynthesis